MNRNVVLVCGGRDFTDWKLVDSVLTEIHRERPITELVEGGASGADCCAWNWAQRNDVPRKTFAAEWEKYGKSAGPTRNFKMLREGCPNLVVAFPGGKGTAQMIGIARAKGVQVREIPASDNPDKREK
jgi:hypothetical protein